MVISSTLNASILLQIISKNQSKCIRYAAYYIINIKIIIIIMIVTVTEEIVLIMMMIRVYSQAD